MEQQQTYRTVDKFDRMLGALADLPDVTQTKPSTIPVFSPIVGEAQTFIVRTFRQREQGDTIFIEYIDSEGGKRYYLPPAVADAIARQRDALSTKVRKRVAKEQAQARKARGELPGFMRGRKQNRGQVTWQTSSRPRPTSPDFSTTWPPTSTGWPSRRRGWTAPPWRPAWPTWRRTPG